MRRAAQLLRRTAPYALTGTAVAACDDKFTVEKVNVIKIPHLRDQGFPGANKSNVAAFGYAKFVSPSRVLGDIGQWTLAHHKGVHASRTEGEAPLRPAGHALRHRDVRRALPWLEHGSKKSRGDIGVETRRRPTRLRHQRRLPRLHERGLGRAARSSRRTASRIYIREGGTLLGTSRGGFDAEKIVEWLRRERVNQLVRHRGDGVPRASTAYKLGAWGSAAEKGVVGATGTHRR